MTRSRLIRSTATLAVLVMMLVACAGNETTTDTTRPDPDPTGTTMPIPETDVQLLKANLPRDLSTDISDDEIADLVAGNSRFAFDLFRVAGGTGENLFFSPHSISAALTMAYSGARGLTADEMRDAMSLGLPGDRLHSARNELDLRITDVPEPTEDDDRDPFSINVANSIWGQAGYPFLDEFLDLLATDYDAGMNLVDFVNKAEQARQDINSWVEHETNGRIVDLIPQGAVDDLTRMVLVNAIWFKANWADKFDPERTEDAPFTRLDGTEVSVPMMHGGARTLYTEGDGYQAVSLRYAGDAAMTIILPEPGRFDEVSANLDLDELNGIRSSWDVHQVDLTLPRFEFRSELNLRSVLEDLGMTSVFVDPGQDPDNGADFTGITEVRELFVTDAFHQAFISVDEDGTEAAAATALLFGVTSAPPPATMTVDRPFILLIEHVSTGEILFFGQVVDPSQG